MSEMRFLRGILEDGKRQVKKQNNAISERLNYCENARTADLLLVAVFWCVQFENKILHVQ